nr:MAG TPA: hypothetical protein [Bacteriophage sp.]
MRNNERLSDSQRLSCANDVKKTATLWRKFI